MFETNPSIGLASVAQRNQYLANSNARQSDANLKAMYEWKAYAQKLENDLIEIRNVRDAEGEANAIELAAWRKAHPVSVMHDIMGTLKDGRSIRRNLSIWTEAFDNAARNRGIINPEAWRIS